MNKSLDNEFTPLDFEPVDTDSFLQYLMATVESFEGTSVGITLSVGGQLISGQLISEKAYFENLRDLVSLFNIHTQTEGIETVKESLKEAFQEFSDKSDRCVNSKSKSQLAVTHIHLKNVKIFLSESQDPISSNNWRGRLESIDGFIFGELEPNGNHL